MRDFNVEEGFERLQFAGLRDFQTLQQFLDRVFPANILDRRLRAECRIAGQDQDRPRWIQAGQKADHRIVLRLSLIHI